MSTQRVILACRLFVWATLACAAPTHAATLDEAVKSVRNLGAAQRKLVLDEGARKEGEVAWYTSMSLTDFPKIVGAFEKSVPYVKVRTNRLSQSSILPKIETEARAGRFAVAQQIPRISLRKGIKQIPRHQELYKKEFVFVNPASIGPNLSELIAT
jgi:ABC-type glycerol-3-phosphate transport system substrate-binding protein